MPYRRKTTRPYRRTTQRRRVPTKAVKAIARKEIFRAAETKEITWQYNALGASSVSLGSVSYGSSAIATQFCSAIARGSNDYNRIGNKILLTGLLMNLAIQPGDNINYFRLLILRPKKGAYFLSGSPSNVTTAAFTQNVLTNAASSSTQWANPVDTDRWRVLMDKQLTLNFHPLDGSTSTTVPVMKFIRRFIKLRLTVQWDESDYVNNDLFALAISDSGAVSHPGAVAGFMRIYYKDF